MSLKMQQKTPFMQTVFFDLVKNCSPLREPFLNGRRRNSEHRASASFLLTPTSSVLPRVVLRLSPFVVSPTQKEKRALTFFYFFVPPKFYRKMEKPVSLFATAASHYEMSNQLFFVLDYAGLLISPCFAAAEALRAISGVLCKFTTANTAIAYAVHSVRSFGRSLRRPLRRRRCLLSAFDNYI